MLANSPISRSTVHSGCSLFVTGPHAAILIEESIKEGPGERKE